MPFWTAGKYNGMVTYSNVSSFEIPKPRTFRGDAIFRILTSGTAESNHSRSISVTPHPESIQTSESAALGIRRTENLAYVQLRNAKPLPRSLLAEVDSTISGFKDESTAGQGPGEEGSGVAKLTSTVLTFEISDLPKSTLIESTFGLPQSFLSVVRPKYLVLALLQLPRKCL